MLGKKNVVLVAHSSRFKRKNHKLMSPFYCELFSWVRFCLFLCIVSHFCQSNCGMETKVKKMKMLSNLWQISFAFVFSFCLQINQEKMHFRESIRFSPTFEYFNFCVFFFFLGVWQKSFSATKMEIIKKIGIPEQQNMSREKSDKNKFACAFDVEMRHRTHMWKWMSRNVENDATEWNNVIIKWNPRGSDTKSLSVLRVYFFFPFCVYVWNTCDCSNTHTQAQTKRKLNGISFFPIFRSRRLWLRVFIFAWHRFALRSFFY